VNNAKKNLKLRITGSLIILTTLMAIIVMVFFTNSVALASGGGGGIKPPATQENTNLKYALISAAAAFGLGALGAGYAISHVGAAAMGAIAEKPQIAGQALIFVALAEGIVVFGFITALMILGKT
jgi:V/A-type H+/Na+-transporting ATPase subunit K